jgi:transcriptional regulator with XRE-family HTH domain
MENSFGNNLKNLRKQNGFTLETLGEKLTISKSTLSDYENGKSTPPFDVCEKIADFFKINIEALRTSGASRMTADTMFVAARNVGDFKNDNEKAKLIAQKNQLEFQNKIASQQVEGLQVQLKLVNQIVESKNSEIRSLQMQIRLLDEKLGDFRTNSPTH